MASKQWARPWFLFSTLGLLGLSIGFVAGCGDDDEYPPGATDPGPGDRPFLPSTVSDARDAAIAEIAATVYAPEANVIQDDGETPASTDMLEVIFASSLGIEADPAQEYLGKNTQTSWRLGFLDTTVTRVRLLGDTVAVQINATIGTDGEISLEKFERSLTTQSSKVDVDDLPVILGDWNVDSDVAIAAMFADTASNASVARETINSLFAEDFYVIPADTLYPPQLAVFSPPDEVEEIGVAGGTVLRVTQVRAGGTETFNFGGETHVLNTSVTPVAAPFTLVFSADASQADHGLFEDDASIQGYQGQAIGTGLGVETEESVALYREGEYWVDVDPGWVDGEVVPSVRDIDDDTVECDCDGMVWEQSADEPCVCEPATLSSSGQTLVITNVPNEKEIEATAYATGELWFTDNPSGDRYAFSSEPDSVSSNKLTYSEIARIEVGDADTVYVDPEDLGIDLEAVTMEVDMVLGTPNGSPDLIWIVGTQFRDQYGNELIFGDPVVDHLPAWIEE